MKNAKLSKTKLATSVSLILAGGMTMPALAQESSELNDVEVIQVSGIRGSMQESMGVKRESSGVVDAISAEDIGKFPDTNLAESLQRITGISINRNNGEGNQVTARGFGPDYNMVTLNGRTMPGSALPANGGTPNSRAYDFSDLASESVRAVEVYKTGRASIATGGIGATINIRTARPFDAYETGFSANVGAKALHDTTNRVNDDVTPEISGFANYVNEDKTFGVTLTGSIQERDSAAVGAFVNEWRVNPFNGTVPQSPDPATNPASGPAVVLNNAPDIGQLFAIPADLRYYVSDRERKRTNAQLTVQFAPSDKLTATLDYTYSKQDLYEARAEQSIWMDDRYFAELTFDDEVVATPIHITQERRDLLPRDLGLALQELNQVNENKSLGINLEYMVNEDFSLVFDAHHSSAEGRPDAPYGTWTNLGLGANVVRGQGADFSVDFPIMTVDFDDLSRSNLNGNGVLDQDDVGTSILDMNFSSQDTEVTQARLDGQYHFDEGSIKFGIESRAMESTSLQSLTRHTMGNWGIENPGELPAGVLTPLNLAEEFTDFNTNGIFSQGFTGSVAEIGAFAASTYGFNLLADNPYATNRTIEEDIVALYFEYDLSGELGGMPYNLLMGLRYEDTETTSIANISLPSAVAWENNNDFNIRFGSAMEDVAYKSDYDHLLPALDFDIEVAENVITRFSYSKTIARPTYNHLSAASDLNQPSSATPFSDRPTASAESGNPYLKPLESDNVDISVEYYFDETSYVSVGFYDKRVRNFIGNEQVEETIYDLRDATAGPRAQAAIAELERLGVPLSDSTLFSMVAAMENGVDFFSMTDEEFEATYDILPNGDDPLLTFINSKPVNNKSANIYGFEIAAQHFFGDTGFGVAANYTTVNGDIAFDINADPSETQFALVGLSDTANLILMYEKDGLQARIAYNWRDKFLNNAAFYVNEPSFTESLSQIDFNVSYDVTEDLTVFLEGINITEEDSRTHGRTSAQLWRMEDLGARYALGARYKF
ncbi:TonB-dependent receptor [Planctobacterium marinum]|nr:TonB-dependent receptor [Planctobacterium marinum]MCC2606710.1 TonB-dependent receptor [Planctobacterium marinum]